MKRRLLFLTERYPPDLGGVAASAFRISRALGSLDLDVDVVAWTRTLEAGRVVSEEVSPRVFRMGRFRQWDATLPHSMNLVDWLTSTQHYDAVWGHYLFPGGFFAAWSGLLKGIPSAVSVRGNDLERDMFPPGDFARLLWTLQRATCVTTVSSDLAQKAAALSARDDIFCIRNAVDHAVFRPPQTTDRERLERLRSSLGIRPEEAVLGFSGELREKKGQRYLIQALSDVQKSRAACLLLIGEIRPSEIPQVLALLEDSSLEERRVIVTGNLTDPALVNDHLALCDVYLQPSLWDGLPNALLEAMAAGCGCIGSDAGGIPDVIVPGINGIIVPRWQLHRLSEAILEWLDAAEADRQCIRSAAREHMIAEFSYEREAALLQTVMDRLMPSSS